MLDRTISRFDVLARWGYSEIADSNFVRYYDNVPGIEALRSKRGTRTVIDDLSANEKAVLASACAQVRPALLRYFGSSDRFRLTALTRSQLGRVRVPPNVWWPDSSGQFVSFAEFTKIPAHDDSDSRNVNGAPESYKLPRDPVTVAHFEQQPLLLDGYHRAVAFWKFAANDASLKAYEQMAE